MTDFLQILYRWMFTHSELNTCKYWFSANKHAALWGFIIMLVVGIVVAFYFYQVYMRTNSFKRAKMRNWLLFGLIGMAACLVISEIVISRISGIPNLSAYIGRQGGCDIIKFCLLNAMIHYSIVYFIASLIISKMPPRLAPKIPV